MCYPCRRTDLLPFSPDRTFGPSNIRLHLTALREHRVHSARGERVPRLWSFACRLLIRALRVTRRRSPRAERTRSAAGEPEPLDRRAKPRLRITRTKKRSHLAAPRIGVVCLTSGSDSRGWALSAGGAVGILVGRLGQLAARAVGAATFRDRALGLSATSTSDSDIGALSRGGASAA